MESLLKVMVPKGGIEPPTQGFSDPESNNGFLFQMSRPHCLCEEPHPRRM